MNILRVDKLSDAEWLNLFKVTYHLPGRDPRCVVARLPAESTTLRHRPV